jgi:hypothetical protein
MSEVSFLDALDGHIDANLAAIPYAASATTIYFGRTYVPEAGTPFITTACPMSGRMITAGQRGVYEWQGIYRVTCFWPTGSGRVEVSEQRDAVRALFTNGMSLATTDGLTMRFKASQVRPLLQTGAWLAGIVEAPWFCHEMQG